MRIHGAIAIALCLSVLPAGCGKSSRQFEQERIASEAARQHAIADSLAEEREKDRQMREAAAAEADAEVARAEGGSMQDPAAPAAAETQATSVGERGEDAEALRGYTERLRQSVSDPGALQLRNAKLAPKRNGMCAEFSARNKAGVYAGFKRVVVTDASVSPEEPPVRDTLNEFLAFQAAAQDTGCFPDVLNVRVAR